MNNYPTYKLGEVADYINGRAFKPSEWKENGLPIVRIQNLNDESAVYHYSDAEHEEKYLLHDGDLLFAWAASLGTYIWNGGEAWLNQHIFKVLPKQNVSKMYLYYALTSIIKELYSKSHGSGMVHVTKGKFEETEIPLPPLPTQQAIVTRIETLFAELDKAVQHLRTAQQQLKTYRQAVLNHWMNNEDGKWEMVPIKEIISVISNGSTPKADKMFSKGEIQFLKVYNLNFDGSINLSKEPVFIERDTHETLLKRSQTKQGDVLINIVGPPLGKVSIIPEGEKEYNINQAIVMFRPNEFVTSKFLAYYLMSPQVIAWLTSTSKATAGQYNVKVSTCREIMFPKISISDQHRIVQEIESRLSQATASETYIENALQQAEALRQSILKKAFSGELVSTLQ